MTDRAANIYTGIFSQQQKLNAKWDSNVINVFMQTSVI
jgi:hypothetical protein